MKFCLCWGRPAFPAVELADVKGELAGCHAEVLPQARFFFLLARLSSRRPRASSKLWVMAR